MITQIAHAKNLVRSNKVKMVFMSLNYRPDKCLLEVSFLRTSIFALLCFENIKYLQGNYQSIGPRKRRYSNRNLELINYSVKKNYK